MDEVKVLYDNIKKRRLALNMSQQELAEAVGYSGKSMISQVEKGLIDLPTTMIEKFAKVLYTTPASLMGWENVIFDPVTGYPIVEEDDGLITVDLNDSPVPTQAEIDEAMNLYKRMKSLPPEMQTALLNLLEAAQTDT